jgi:hypothetical protein
MSSESYEICNNYQIYSPGEIWTIYFSNAKAGDTITIENYSTEGIVDGAYTEETGKSVTNTFGQEITFPNTDPPSGDSPCGSNTSAGRCYTIQNLIPQEAGKTIHTSPDTKISMNNNIANGTGLCNEQLQYKLCTIRNTHPDYWPIQTEFSCPKGKSIHRQPWRYCCVSTAISSDGRKLASIK